MIKRLIAQACTDHVGTPGAAVASRLRSLLAHDGAIRQHERFEVFLVGADFAQFIRVGEAEVDPPVITVHRDGNWERV